ncbi:arginine-tRNA ligase [Rhinocladiella mackenziei CBS 650.93]|uniref:arginine--tRNA ligase n=1 Tax=Rhinocladiella mackenziei CBS 650.93 TaxID=1442369 RepID=A0A0D2IUU0_9EURO|nr:arginine-tRNA ligase [Rhinocladiella mackenziei CBS 650.93]KIX09864.1 arginine-tRNA ligase [Rhinocladiella mackenziei CBS 650.93]
MSTRTANGLQGLLGGLGIERPTPSLKVADIQNNPMDLFASYLADDLSQLTKCSSEEAYGSIHWPNELGDLVVAVAKLQLHDIPPGDLATDLRERFPASPLFAHPFEDGNQLRVFFNPTTLARVLLPYIIDRGQLYGTDRSDEHRELDSPEGKRKKIIVDFSSPNMGNEFNGMHLRSTLIGAYIVAIHEALGWDVYKMNYIGDWGKHIGLLAVGWARFGSEELFETDPLRHLLDVYVEIEKEFKAEVEAAKKSRAENPDNPVHEPIAAERDEFFKKMEDRDPNALALWQRFHDVSVEKYTDVYARLNIQFDDSGGESQVSPDTIAEVEAILTQKGVYEESKGARIIDFKKHGAEGLRTGVLRFSNGTTSYLLRDIAAVLDRSTKHNFDKMYYVVSMNQTPHFLQLFKALELMGRSDLTERLKHVSFGKAEGLSKPPNSNGLLLRDILDQCRDSMQHLLKEHQDELIEFQGDNSSKISDFLGGCALMTQDLSIRRAAAFTFDTEKMGAMYGHTGLSLQKWYLRLRSKLLGVMIDRDELAKLDYSLFEEEVFADVLRLLVQFPGIVKVSFNHIESSIILTYLFKLCDSLFAVWEREEEEESGGSQQVLTKFAFYECVCQVLENGMKMVGLVPMKMYG